MITILQGDCLDRLRELPDGCVHMCVTSPPYWGLRDYGVAGQIGLEPTPEEYVAKLVAVFREVKRVLRDDGTLWLNLGDSYATTSGGGQQVAQSNTGAGMAANRVGAGKIPGIKPKDLVGIPWRVAFALQADGWYLRSEIIWAKRNCMPESVEDRPTKAHEQIFLLAKSSTYFYDSEAIKEPAVYADGMNSSHPVKSPYGQGFQAGRSDGSTDGMRNKRSVWTVTGQPYVGAHFATYPPDLIKPCILAGTSAKGCCPHCGAPWERITEVVGTQKMKWGTSGDDEVNARTATISGGTRMPALRDGTVQIHSTVGWQPTCTHKHNTVPCTVLDPFGGSGTTGEVAVELGRKAILIELNPEYIALIKQRTNVTPGLPLC